MLGKLPKRLLDCHRPQERSMSRIKNGTRRHFLTSMSASVPAAAFLGVDAPVRSTREPAAESASTAEPGGVIDLGSVIAGDDAILFRRHTLDLGCAETVTVADINGDGRLDIVSGENWYEQLPPQAGRGPRFVKRKFRELGYTDYYLEDLSDLAIDVDGDAYPDIVTCSYWS
jgi:hypothetical protein